MVILWNRLQLGRYIRAVTGHNNLLYHLSNIDPDIYPTCRYCLDAREEFNHLANDCPALWLERHTINSQDPDHSSPEQWTPLQIVDFTFFPKINDAFAKPLYVLTRRSAEENAQDVDDPQHHSETESELSNMDVSSEAPSTELSDDSDNASEVSIMSGVE